MSATVPQSRPEVPPSPLTSLVLTPMQVQFLVGLFCCRHMPDAVKIVVGDSLKDAVLAEERDVDVTVVHAASEGVASCVGLEVQRRLSAPMAINVAESLIQKLRDIPSITSPGIVSVAGFTPNTLTKLHHYGIKAFELSVWDRPLVELFPKLTLQGPPSVCLNTHSITVQWQPLDSFKANPSDPEREKYKSYAKVSAELRSADGTIAAGTIGDELRKLMAFSAGEIGKSMKQWDPNELAGKDLSKPHPIDAIPAQCVLELEAPLHVQSPSGLLEITEIELRGRVERTVMVAPSEFWAMREVGSEVAFAGAAISPVQGTDDQLIALVLSPHDTLIAPQIIRLLDEHKHMIRRLHLR